MIVPFLFFENKRQQAHAGLVANARPHSIEQREI
jgi:hypothetical protein